jgi:hypothetical protein
MSNPAINAQDSVSFSSKNERKEARLEEIRSQSRQFGSIDAKGVVPPGAPFPVASPETGYYGIPLLKAPQWKPEVPVYFFVGGAAGASSVIGAIAHLTGRDKKIARDARLIAVAGAAISSGLLISDLGRPKRFLNMLRMFKPQSPMSMGAWILAGFGTFSGAAAAAQLLSDRLGLGTFRIAGNMAEGFAALFGLPFSNYTGVLLGATAIPVWNQNVGTLPFHFGMSGMNTAVSVLELMGNDTSKALNRIAIISSAAETLEGVKLEFRRDPEINEPLKHGASGWITRAGGVLSGPVPLALRLAAELSGPKRSRSLRRIAAGSSIIGSLLTRIGWVKAGSVSAKDWRLPLREASRGQSAGTRSTAQLLPKAS